MPWLKNLGLAPYFEIIVASHDQRVRSAKPDTAIFKYALNAVGVSAEEAVHVGDSFEADIIGAHTAGIRAILLDPRWNAGWTVGRDHPDLTCVARSVKRETRFAHVKNYCDKSCRGLPPSLSP